MSVLKLKRKRPTGPAGQRRVARQRRHARILKKVRGTSERPRLVVRRTLKHLEAQLVDDERSLCITGVSTRAKGLQQNLEGKRDKAAQSRVAGQLMAERAQAKGVTEVVFDRGGYQYHGRVKAFAEGAREGGLEF